MAVESVSKAYTPKLDFGFAFEGLSSTEEGWLRAWLVCIRKLLAVSGFIEAAAAAAAAAVSDDASADLC